MLLLLLIIFIIVLIAIDRCLYCVLLFDLYFIDLSLFFLIVFSSFRPPSPLPPSPARTHTSPLKQWRVKACVCCNYKAFATPRMEILVVYLYLSSCFYGFFFGDSCIHFFLSSCLFSLSCLVSLLPRFPAALLPFLSVFERRFLVGVRIMHG